MRAKITARRTTLDGELVDYWTREALRLDTLAAGARWNWMARSYQRKAERARAQGAVFAAREAARVKASGLDQPGPADSGTA
ncbi:hypothetical protein ASF60_11365 [Methylobacterium sp. Leaf113]|nr:hypothetical protein ASF60_11365 [Methylobacterium sp. Leaf113]